MLTIVLSLALFKTGVLFVDDVQSAFATYDLAVCTALFNCCSYFHCYAVKRSCYLYLYM